MNSYQELWWEQTRADLLLLESLRKNGAEPCHQLHYLQMVTEKLGKAYAWRAGKPPNKSHKAFVAFLKQLNIRKDRAKISKLFGYGKPKLFAAGIKSVMPLAHDLENLAPALAGDFGPNPEYPWPFDEPRYAPILYRFEIWDRLWTREGRTLIGLIDAAVLKFPDYN